MSISLGLAAALLQSVPAAANDDVQPADCPRNNPSYEMVSLGEHYDGAVPVTVGAYANFAAVYNVSYWDIGTCVQVGTIWLEPNVREGQTAFTYGAVLSPGLLGGDLGRIEVVVYPGSKTVCLSVTPGHDYRCYNE